MMEQIGESFREARHSSSEMAEGVSKLLQLHGILLLVELKEQQKRLMMGVSLLLGVFVVALCAVALGAIALVLFIDGASESLSLGQSALLVCALALTLAVVGGVFGLRLLKKITLVPRATFASLKENIQCIMAIN